MKGGDEALCHWRSVRKAFPQSVLDEWWGSAEMPRPRIESLSKRRNEELCGTNVGYL